METVSSPLLAIDAFPPCRISSPSVSSVSSESSPCESRGRRHWQAFLLLGHTHLYFWNVFLNALDDLSLDVYPSSNINTVIALYVSFNVISLLVVMEFNLQLNSRAFLMSTLALGTSHLLLASAAQWAPGQTTTLLSVVSLAGGASGASQACAYGLAASTPTIYSGWVSTGNGMAGVVSFPLWLLLTWLLFPNHTLASLWFVSLLGTIFCLISCIAYLNIRRDRVLARRLQERIILAKDLRRHPDYPTNWNLIRKSWQSCAALILVVYVSLMIYPNIVPLGWADEDQFHMNVLLGEFQVGDFVGRYIPLVGPLWTLPNLSRLLRWSLLRTLIVVPVYVEMKHQNGRFWYHSLLVLLLALTNGWLTTAAMIRGVQKLRSFRYQPYRDRFSSLLVLFLVMSICLGLWTCDLISPYLLEKP
eukprot:Gregarina_sp_Poly_1__6596@NODE_353_length_9300_cov_96_781761_g295_i0_p4_GENE_NODE_353_length_9300_cov_96_781761_g295_i0NODE_353_length_9300_cov_96_781761_g295_i0_p4_ORF_typecomplete_len418_score23_20Nucleoside_tran/PF01733_18/2_4e03Nucleoside_tran/PF01733_18/1_8e36CLN3/PF02487_17/5_6e08Fuseless/PF15993_5/1_6e03Fuseless/PF15993_5/4_4e02Fuseless/PF15993_5/0_019Fuseless/PF15993_5/1e03_NODE_353_length_9300_cov_96_781761_g295_i029474200